MNPFCLFSVPKINQREFAMAQALLICLSIFKA